MITQLPTYNDFEDAGVSYLNMAWDIVADLYWHIENSDIELWDDNDEETDAYWKAAQKPLANALSLVQQGIEFLLKAKIIYVSPFLLLYGSPRDWPAKCQSVDTQFADFKTIDSQDLIRVHDTVLSSRLDESFKGLIEKLRRNRNSIMHTVDVALRISSLDIFIDILEVSHHLLAPKKWGFYRRSYLEETHTSVAYSPDHIELLVIREFLTVLDFTKPSAALKYFDFNKKQRKYICSNCAHNSGDDGLLPETALLRPNSPSSTNVYCFICDTEYSVKRQKCAQKECKGNVIELEENVCLTCLES